LPTKRNSKLSFSLWNQKLSTKIKIF
jgi:hypothetical protein